MTRVLRNIFNKVKQKLDQLDKMPEVISDNLLSPSSKFKWYTEAPPVIYSKPKPTMGKCYTVKTGIIDYSAYKCAEIARQLHGLPLEEAYDQMLLGTRKPNNIICNALIRAVKEIRETPNSIRGLRKVEDGVKQDRPAIPSTFRLKKPLHAMEQSRKKIVKTVTNKSMPRSGLFVKHITCGKRNSYTGIRHHGRGRMAKFRKPFTQMWITLVQSDFMYRNRGNVSHPSKSPRHPRRVTPSRIFVGGLLERRK